jgi:hypothetical protein
VTVAKSKLDVHSNEFWTWNPLPTDLDERNETHFEISPDAWHVLNVYMQSVIEGNATALWEKDFSAQSYLYSSDLINGAWDGSQHPQVWIENLATSMTNAVRVTNTTSRDQYNGTHYELSIEIRWWWLVGPVALVSSSIIFLVAVMIRTASHREAQSWKGSPLTFLIFDLQSEVKNAAFRQMEDAGWDACRKRLGKTRVRFIAEAESERGFRKS